MAIISFRHQFIFVKTTKTAGTSIEVDLSRVAGNDAVVTPILPPVKGHQARNFQDLGGHAIFYNHMPAKAIRGQIGQPKFDGMFKFCVEREPVAKCISHFHMLRNSPLHNPDGAYTKDWDAYCAEGRFPVDIDKYSEIRDGQRVLMVNKVFPYEDIGKTLPRVLRQLGITDFALVARAKSGYSRNKLVDISAVTAAQRSRIYTAFATSCAVSGLYQKVG